MTKMKMRRIITIDIEYNDDEESGMNRMHVFALLPYARAREDSRRAKCLPGLWPPIESREIARSESHLHGAQMTHG